MGTAEPPDVRGRSGRPSPPPGYGGSGPYAEPGGRHSAPAGPPDGPPAPYGQAPDPRRGPWAGDERASGGRFEPGRFEPGPYAYDPYGSDAAPPAGLAPGDPSPAARPGVMILSLVLLLLSAVPYLLVGGLLALASATIPTDRPPEVLAPLQEDGYDIRALLLTGGLVLVVPAVLLIGLAIAAFRGSRVGRVGVTVLVAAFALAVVAFLVGGVAAVGRAGQTVVLDAGSVLVIVGPVVLAVVGVVLLFVPAARRFFAGRRR